MHEPKVVTITHHPRVPLCEIMKIYEKVNPISVFAVERDPRNPNRQKITIEFEDNEIDIEMAGNINDYEFEVERNMNNRPIVRDLKQRLLRPITILRCFFPDASRGRNKINTLLNHFKEFGKLQAHRIIHDYYGEPSVAYIKYKDGEAARKARFWGDPIYRITYIMDHESPFKNETNMPIVQEMRLVTESQHQKGFDNVLDATALSEKLQNTAIDDQENAKHQNK